MVNCASQGDSLELMPDLLLHASYLSPLAPLGQRLLTIL